jgi:succinate-semialdehyde dehydrogenase/glutarate-semialdehyde dehydrogenase
MTAQPLPAPATYDTRPQLFVAGEWIDAAARNSRPVINPATGGAIAQLPCATIADLDRALAAAEAAFLIWKRTPAYERSRILREAASLIRQRAERIARAITMEEGKPLREARGEAASAADIFDWFAEEGRRAYGRTIPARHPDARFTVYQEPVGPVAAFTPWNFPASGPARKIAGALAPGCSCIIKPAEETPSAALELARALDDAGLPRGVLNVVFGDPAEISNHLILSDTIRKISFTGSTAIGKHLAGLAARGAKPATLELGGHAPVIICSDADLALTVSVTADAKLRNAGQVCTSPTRFFVHRSIHEAFLSGLSERFDAVQVGDGLQDVHGMGPLANARRIDALDTLIGDAVTSGASLVSGGNRHGNVGYGWRPTILAAVPAHARVMREEPFGPLAATIPFDDIDEVLAAANSLPFGLAGYVFTRSLDLATRLPAALQTGMVGLNTYALGAPETPFGGVKESGYGSEGGAEGLSAYLSTKLISQGAH